MDLGNIRRRLEVHFRFPLNRWKSPPPTLRDGEWRVENHNNWRSPSWQSPISKSCIHAMCHGDGRLSAKAQSHASDNYARWEVGQEEGLGPKRGSGVLFYDRTQLYKKQSHNRRMDNLEHTNQQ